LSGPLLSSPEFYSGTLEYFSMNMKYHADDASTLDAAPSKSWVPTEVHNWEGKETNVLVLNYTMACPLRCDFCCYGCHSGRVAQTMPFERAIELVDQAASLGVFSSIGFTGGEPLLFLDEIAAVAEHANSLGLPHTVATACHWAGTMDDARATVARLAGAGLRRMNISHDPAHAEFVAAENVANAARAAVEHEVPTYIVGTFYSPAESLALLLPQLEDLPGVHFLDKYVAKVGRAQKRHITQASYGLALSLENLCCYRRVHHDLVVFWDGRTYPCCSTFNRATPGISVGDAFSEPLEQIWDRTDGSLLLRAMKRQGFGEVYSLIRELDPGLAAELPAAEETVGPCSLCNKIFGDAELAARIKAAFSALEEERVNRAIETLAKRIGKERTAALMTAILDHESSASVQVETVERKEGSHG
jgi:hypothetical protein